MPGLRLVTAASATAAAGLDGDDSPGTVFSASCDFATSPVGTLPKASPCGLSLPLHVASTNATTTTATLRKGAMDAAL
jgi:hypothetical protein